MVNPAPALAPAAEVRRRRRATTEWPGWARRPRRLSLSPLVIGLALLAAVGSGAGLALLIGTVGFRPPVTVNQPGAGGPSAPAPALEPVTIPAAAPGVDRAEETEAAYAALEAGRTAEARDRFLSLASRAEPGERAGSALRAAAAWCELSAGHTDAAEGILVASLSRASGGESADARFLLGLSRLQRGEHAEAEKNFARAAALDPTRPDVHLLWGETLRREGRPRESLPHLRAALRRNRLETDAGFYLLKLWLAQLQAGGDDAAEVEKTLAAALAGNPPGGTVFLGAAALAVTRGNWPEAAGFLRRARPGTEPAVFALCLQDPLFAEERGRPELAEFFPPPRPATGTR